jgi:long-chain acyl-CoA synthetase
VCGNALALQRLYHFEAPAPGSIVLTKPFGAGTIREMSLHDVLAEARQMAARLQALVLAATRI